MPPVIQLGGLGERCKPQPKSNLVHFSLKILTPCDNNFNNFPENELTKFRAFRDSGRDSVAIDDETVLGGIYTIRTTCWVMHNECACGSPVIGWSTHARACT